MKADMHSKAVRVSKLVARYTVTFQPSTEAQRLLDVADRANLNRSELLNTLIEKHLAPLLREQVAAIEDALTELRSVAGGGSARDILNDAMRTAKK